ncbi:putative choline transporter, neither null mutation nor overexpression affects choline transport [Tieghemiomyces parasiticus]|uniref:Protein PNS1 n=1 Tax=Tieghemiomyces parasiticus TaxID=78921 RepID=A0A9W8AKU5_9FUNG|nr:putative choline transporter, neither null mutation nor overexpression affects choline transport [Tieghemiomyces parasiticus]
MSQPYYQNQPGYLPPSQGEGAGFYGASNYPPPQPPGQGIYPPPQAPPMNYHQGGQPGAGYPQPPPMNYNQGGQPGASYPQPPPGYDYQNGQGPPPKPAVVDSEKYNRTPVFRDVWAAILFFITLGSFVVYSVLAIRSLPSGTFSNPGKYRASEHFFSLPTIVCFLIVALTGFVISVVYMFLIQAAPRAMIIVSYWASVAIGLATAGYYFYRHLWWAAALALVFAILSIVAWFYARHRIPLATILLTTVVRIMRRFPATVYTGVLFLILNVLFLMWWAITLTATFSYLKHYESCRRFTNSAGRPDETCTNGRLIGVIVYLCFVWYWVTQVLYNVLHTTICGLYATVYFFDNSPMGFPTANPTMAAFKRATTNSFGSVCFGSLLVALFQTVRAILQTLLNAGGDDGIGAFIACCVGCVLGLIQSMLEFFNKYAYVEIAMYGKPFVPAARDTWKLIKNRGIDTLINDDLIGNVIGLGGIVVGGVCAMVGYGYISVVKPVYNATGNFTPVIVLIGFFIGISLFYLAGKVIDSGNATTFVCLAEDPAAMQRSKPELFEKIREAYPQVVSGIHHG